MRIAIGGIIHESNTFNPTLTDLAAFQLDRGKQILVRWRDAHHEVGGFISGVLASGCELAPTLTAWATPSGMVTAEAFEVLTGELAEGLSSARPVDGVLLALHGAMVSESFPSGDGEIVRRIRRLLGGDIPIVVTLDFHANISEQLVEESSALVVYKTNPHLDQRKRGLQAAGILNRMIGGEVTPVAVLRSLPMLLNVVHQYTSVEPMKSVMEAAQQSERKAGVLAANVAAGYQYADVPHMGPSVVVVTDRDDGLAEYETARLARQVWDVRNRLSVDLPDATLAVQLAMESTETPVVIVDTGDNIGGGSAGDSTFILAKLLDLAARSWVVTLADPEAATKCKRAGVGALVDLHVGGKKDAFHGDSIRVHGRVKCLHDGRYVDTEPRHGGRRHYDQGLTAVLEVLAPNADAQGLLVLTTKREQPLSLNQLESVGVRPELQRILVVKAAIAYRAAYEPIAGRIIEAGTPGLTAIEPSRFEYRHVRRPMWGLNH